MTMTTTPVHTRPTALLFLVVTALGQRYAPFASVFAAPSAAAAATVAASGWGGWLRALAAHAAWVYVCVFAVKSKYYFAWIASEGAANLAGWG